MTKRNKLRSGARKLESIVIDADDTDTVHVDAAADADPVELLLAQTMLSVYEKHIDGSIAMEYRHEREKIEMTVDWSITSDTVSFHDLTGISAVELSNQFQEAFKTDWVAFKAMVTAKEVVISELGSISLILKLNSAIRKVPINAASIASKVCMILFSYCLLIVCLLFAYWFTATVVILMSY